MRIGALRLGFLVDLRILAALEVLELLEWLRNQGPSGNPHPSPPPRIALPKHVIQVNSSFSIFVGMRVAEERKR
jgi:hypothetical protein